MLYGRLYAPPDDIYTRQPAIVTRFLIREWTGITELGPTISIINHCFIRVHLKSIAQFLYVYYCSNILENGLAGW